MIESKYTIEYVNPESEKKNKTKPRKSILSFIFSGILLAGLVFLVLNNLPKNTVNEHKVITSTKPTSTEKKLLTDNKSAAKIKQVMPTQEKQETIDDTNITENKKITSIQPLEKKLVVNTPETISNTLMTSNKSTEKEAETIEPMLTSDIEKSLALLKTQLLETQQKNKELATELDAQIMENMELSTLLEDSLYKINKKDKSYINELEKLEKNTVNTPPKISLKKNTKTKKENSLETADTGKDNLKDTSTKSLESTHSIKSIKKSNQVDLSTSSQVNAIIAAMKNKKGSSSNTLKSESSKVELQDEINQIINNKNTGNVNNFQKSLNKI